MDAYFIGQVLGFVALTSMVVQLVLASRSKFLDKRFGLGRMMTWHKYNAYIMLSALLVHPTLVFYRFLFTSIPLADFASARQFFSLPIWLGEAAFGIILFTIAFTLLSKKFNWDYQKWRFLHKIGYVAVTLGFAHSYMIGSHIITRGLGFYYWVFLGVTALAAVGYRYGYRWWKLRDQLYEVVKIKKETHNVRSIWLEPVQRRGTRTQGCGQWRQRPGQFSFVKFYSDDLPREEHHFTISSPPSHNPIRFTIKESGDFTSQLDKLKVGDRAKLDGPYGGFTLDKAPKQERFLFLAGGIGITPIMSMLEDIYADRHSGAPARESTLIYANKTEEDIVFKERLDEIAEKTNLNVVHVLSQEQKQGFYHGYVTKDIIKKEVPDVTEREIFLVGPPPMMTAVEKSLINLGVPRNRVHTEKFSLR